MKSTKFQNKYRIPSARAQWHDYNGGEYFITICTAGKAHYFGEIADNVMALNKLGLKLNELIDTIKIHNQYAEIPLYQVMPNHVHLIVCIDETVETRQPVETRHATSLQPVETQQPVETRHATSLQKQQQQQQQQKNEKMQNIAEKCGLLSTVIGGLKSATTRFANDCQIEFGWQTRFHDHIIRNQAEMNRIATYIENNPSTWEDDQFYSV